MVRLLALVGLVVALCVPAAAQAATTVQKSPLDTSVVLCNGDIVELSGTLLFTSTTTATPSGGFVEAYHFQPQGVSGVDTTTGTVYHGVGVTRETVISTPAGGGTGTYVNRFHIQATRGAESFLVSALYHLTIGPDGGIRVEVSRFSSTC